jgi:hypothetical protein
MTRSSHQAERPAGIKSLRLCFPSVAFRKTAAMQHTTGVLLASRAPLPSFSLARKGGVGGGRWSNAGQIVDKESTAETTGHVPGRLLKLDTCQACGSTDRTSHATSRTGHVSDLVLVGRGVDAVHHHRAALAQRAQRVEDVRAGLPGDEAAWSNTGAGRIRWSNRMAASARA